MEQLTDAQIECAVNWWADRLNNKKFQALSPEERQDPQNKSMVLAEMLATVQADCYSTDQIGRFKKALRTGLQSAGALWGIGVDYHPDCILSSALVAADIKNAMLALPWKTWMNFRDGGVQACMGYGEPFAELLIKAAT